MGTTKTADFTPAQLRLAQIAKALGHPARIAIVQYLLNSSECMCGDIVEVVPLSQSTVSQHLRELKEAGIIQGRIEGVKSCYCINPAAWEEVRSAMGGLLQPYTCGPGCC